MKTKSYSFKFILKLFLLIKFTVLINQSDMRITLRKFLRNWVKMKKWTSPSEKTDLRKWWDQVEKWNIFLSEKIDWFDCLLSHQWFSFSNKEKSEVLDSRLWNKISSCIHLINFIIRKEKLIKKSAGEIPDRIISLPLSQIKNSQKTPLNSKKNQTYFFWTLLQYESFLLSKWISLFPDLKPPPNSVHPTWPPLGRKKDHTICAIFNLNFCLHENLFYSYHEWFMMISS